MLVQPFLILYLTGPRHLTVAAAGTVITVWGVGSFVSQPAGGYLADRVGRRATMALGMFALAAATVLLAIARGLPAITLTALLLGLVGDIYRPAAAATIADLLDGDQRTRGYALQVWAINLGFTASAVSAGILVRLGFSTMFAVDALTSLAFGFIVLRKVPETRTARTTPRSRDEHAWRTMVRDKTLLALVALLLCYATLYGQTAIALPLAVRDAGLGAAAYGPIMAVNGIVIVCVQPLTVNLVARAPRVVLLPAGMLLLGGGVALYGLCRSMWAFALTTIVWTLGEIAESAALQALLAAIAPPALRGRYLGTAGLAWGASSVLSAFVGAHVYAASPGALWSGCLGVSVVAASCLAVVVARLPQTVQPLTG